MENKKINSLFRNIKNKLNNMTDKEFLSCQTFYNMVKAQIDGMLKPSERVTVEFESTDSNTTAYTTGTLVHANTWSPLAIAQDNRYLKYLANIGSASHEVAHVLYTNFDLLNEIRTDIDDGNYKFKYSEELSKRNPMVKKMFAQEMCDMINIIEDCYIEECLAKEYPSTGIVIQGLNTKNKAKYDLSSSLKKLEDRVQNNELTLLSLGVAMLQIYCCLGYEPKDMDKCSGAIHDALIKFIRKANDILVEYRSTNKNHENNIREFVELCYTLLPEDDELFNGNQMRMPNFGDGIECSDDNGEGDSEEQNEGDSSNGSNEQSSSQNSEKSENEDNNENSSSSADEGENDSSDENNQEGNGSQSKLSNDLDQEEIKNMINKMMQNSKSAKEESGMSEEARGKGKGMRNAPSLSNDDTSDDNKNSSIVDQSERLTSDMAEQELQNAINEENKKESDANTKEVMDKYFPRGCDYVSDVTQRWYTNRQNKVAYDRYYNEIKDTSKKCQRRIKQILETRPDDDYDSGHLMGSRFNVNDIYRKDGKYFSREVVPADQPDVAFSVLVDNSGSMGGPKIRTAIKTAILFEDICTGLNIPLQITAHDADYGVQLGRCVDYNRTKIDKYSLVEMDARNANVDTIALSVVANQLSKRPEKSKVLIVISDGRPCGYRGQRENDFMGVPFKKLQCKYQDNLMQELNACVRYWTKKKGITVIGIGIDSGEAVKAIYEDKFLDCTNLDKLPSEMVKIFKKYVLK